MARESSLFGENAYKRTSRDVVEEREAGFGRLNDYWNNHRVEMRWSNEAGLFEDDQIFTVEVGLRDKDIKNKKVKMALSKEELLRFLRYI